MNIDGKRLTENQRMALLRAEEHDALGIQPLEIRLAMNLFSALAWFAYDTKTDCNTYRMRKLKSRGCKSRTLIKSPHTPPTSCESGLHELIEFASLAKVMG
jgi:hypothetical protein